MAKFGPVDYQWTGEAMRPLSRHLAQVQEHCIVGAVYRLEPARRSKRSHDHQFAWIDEAWHNLPDALKEKHESPEHLRKWALCMTGFCSKISRVCRSRKEANELELWVLYHEQYAITDITPVDDSDPDGPCVLVSRLAESQRKQVMGGARFEASKEAVLNKLADLLGTTPEALERSAKEAA